LKTDQIKVGQKLKIPGKGSDTAPAAAAGGTGTNS
jgi:LysM repeat protein